MLLFSKRGRRARRGRLGGGVTTFLLLAALPLLYRRFVHKKNAGRYGLREAYSPGSEWAPVTPA